MVMVGSDAAGVDDALVGGKLLCPACGGVLGPWGHARARPVRCVDVSGSGAVRVCPRRARCVGCGRTHVLLPRFMLARRADGVAVIGAALAAKAATELGHRVIAERVGRPAATVRGWLRRFAVNAEALRGLFTGLVVALDPMAREFVPAGSVFADAVEAVGRAAAAAVGRFEAGGDPVDGLSPWQLAAAATGGRLLAPPATVKTINTSCPWWPLR